MGAAATSPLGTSLGDIHQNWLLHGYSCRCWKRAGVFYVVVVFLLVGCFFFPFPNSLEFKLFS